MKHQLQTIRAAVDMCLLVNPEKAEKALSALAEIERTYTSVTAGQEPFAHYVYFPDQQRGEFAHDLDELCEDMTNDENHEVTALYTAAPVAQQPQAETDESIAADAYVIACEEMERWQHERRKAGKEVGTTGSLCDGIAWLYGYINDLETKQPQAEAVPDEPSIAACIIGSQAVGGVIDGHQAAAVYCAMRKAKPQQAESYEELVNALHRVDSAAVFLPTFKVRHEGGIEAVTQNIVEAIEAACKQPQGEAVPDKEDFCYCNDEISLQIVSGGGASEGLYGRVVLKINGEYVNYVRADSWQETPMARALEFVARHKSSDWPERCQQMVDMARAALAAPQQAEAVPQELLDYEAPALASEYDGFICDMAIQHGAVMLNEEGSVYAFTQEQLLAFTKANRAAPQQAEAVPSDVVRDVEAAAKKMAEIFDYPWDFMPEKGRSTMRENVRAILAAAQGEKP